MSVKENLKHILSEIPSNVTLVAVSKTKPNELILEAYNAGQRDFGENYVQELCDKATLLPKDIKWHFIGHLQSNKVKYIAPFVHLIHGVDSLSLLKEINKHGLKNNRMINCLLQLYVAQEETKFGLDFNEAENILASKELKQLSHVAVKGFMGMASNTDDTKQIEKEFKSLKAFSDTQPYIKAEYLSFGMSSDYKLAINCGSNMLRIGSSIFGERYYNNG